MADVNRTKAHSSQIMSAIEMIYRLEELQRLWEKNGLELKWLDQYSQCLDALSNAISSEVDAGRDFSDLLQAAAAGDNSRKR